MARQLSLDALRGVAVILMMEQHLGTWLWQVADPSRSLVAQAPLYMGLNALGGLAAPIFITLAGAGVSFLVAGRAHRSVDAILVRRGLGLLGFGYLLNWLTPSWFSPGSWFVLHLMGLGIATSPLWRRLPDAALLALEAGILAATVAVQAWLRTPILLDNSRMRDLDLPGGAARLALAEGQFPVLPWLGVFLAGVVVGRWVLAGQHARITALLRICVGVGVVLVGLQYGAHHLPSLSFLKAEPWRRVITVRTSFYPAGPGIVLLLQAGVLLLLRTALWVEAVRELAPRGVLVCLGRASLTLLLVHVVLFRELSRPLGAWQAFDWPVALAIIAAWTVVCALLARAWQRIDYRFGAEWLLRRIGG